MYTINSSCFLTLTLAGGGGGGGAIGAWTGRCLANYNTECEEEQAAGQKYCWKHSCKQCHFSPLQQFHQFQDEQASSPRSQPLSSQDKLASLLDLTAQLH